MKTRTGPQRPRHSHHRRSGSGDWGLDTVAGSVPNVGVVSGTALRAVAGIVVALALVAGACGDAEGSGPLRLVANTTAPATTSIALSTEPAPTTLSAGSTPSATDAPVVAVATVEAWIQRWLDDDYAAGAHATDLRSAPELVCGDSGVVRAGDVLECALRTDSVSAGSVEEATVIYVLDASGRAAWSAASDNPTTLAMLRQAYASAPQGLLCVDLASPDTSAFPFTGAGRPAPSAFFWSLVYWSFEGRPASMDADRDGVPCETLFARDVVASVLAGGPTY